MTRRALLPYAPLLAACLLGAALTAAAYWPGFMTWDAIRQYDQALNGDFDDWHPPVMEWVWRRFLGLAIGPAPMLLLQLTLEWGGLAALGGWALRGRRPWLAAALVACGFLPFALALTGEVLKDCLMAGALLCAAATLAWQDRSARPGLLAIAGIMLLLFAATLRFNAFLATVPLCVALLPTSWRATKLRFAASVLLSFALTTAALPIANRLTGARPSDVSLSLVIFDLGGITARSGQDVFPTLGIANPVAANARCYNPERWDPYSWWVDPICPMNFTNIQQAFRQGRINPYVFWLKTVATHPVAYAQHRLTHFDGAIRLFARAVDERGVQLELPPNIWGYKLRPGPLVLAIDGAAVWICATPLGWPATWIAVAMGLLVLVPVLPSRRIVLPLALSAALYGFGYAVFGVASELRYHLWTMLAVAVAGIIAGAEVRTVRLGRSRALAAAAFPVLTVLAGTAWRIAVPG